MYYRPRKHRLCEPAYDSKRTPLHVKITKLFSEALTVYAFSLSNEPISIENYKKSKVPACYYILYNCILYFFTGPFSLLNYMIISLDVFCLPCFND